MIKKNNNITTKLLSWDKNAYELRLNKSREKLKESHEKYLESIIKPWCIAHQSINRKELEVWWKLIYRNLETYRSLIANHLSKKSMSTEEFALIYHEEFESRISQRTINQWDNNAQYIIWAKDNGLVEHVAYKKFEPHEKNGLQWANEMKQLLLDLSDRFGFDADPEQGEPMLAPVFLAMMLGIGLRWSIDKTWKASRVGVNTFVLFWEGNETYDPALIVISQDTSLNESKLTGQAFPQINFKPSTLSP